MAAEDRFTHHPIVVTDDKWMHHYFDNPYKAAKATGLSYELIREIVFDHKEAKMGGSEGFEPGQLYSISDLEILYL